MKVLNIWGFDRPNNKTIGLKKHCITGNKLQTHMIFGQLFILLLFILVCLVQLFFQKAFTVALEFGLFSVNAKNLHNVLLIDLVIRHKPDIDQAMAAHDKE